MLSDIISFLPVVVAPFILLVWTLVTAYVYKFGMRGSGIGLDYIIFTILVVVALLRGGAL